MSSQNVQIIFNVSGNATTAMASISQQALSLEKNIAHTTNIFKSFGGGIIVAQQISQSIQGVCSGIEGLQASGKQVKQAKDWRVLKNTLDLQQKNLAALP